MRLSQTAEYALRAALHMAEHDGGTAIPVGDIAKSLGVPRNYLSKILHQLARAGVLVSTRGPGGGFRLRDSPDQLTLAEVVSPVDPIADERRCLLGREECSNINPCAAHGRWGAIAESMRAFFFETTLADLATRGGKESRRKQAIP